MIAEAESGQYRAMNPLDSLIKKQAQMQCQKHTNALNDNQKAKLRSVLDILGETRKLVCLLQNTSQRLR